MQTVKITLAGKTYDVQKLPIRQNREWRQKFDEPIGKLLGAAKAVGQLSKQEWKDTREMMSTVGIVLATHVDDIVRVLLDSMDLITQAVFDYSPVLKREKHLIEEHGFDDEMVRAFVEVVQLAYPFSPVIKSMIQLGSQVDGISQSSPEPSGDSGKTS